MMRRTAVASLTLMALFLGTSAAAAAPTVDLRPKLEEGRVSRYQLWLKRQQRNRIEGGPEQMQQAQQRAALTQTQVEGEITWRVERVRPDGSGACTMVVDWLKAEIKDPKGNEHRLDTREGPSSPKAMYRVLDAVAGTPIGVEVAPDGTIDSVSGHEAVSDALENPDRAPSRRDFVEDATLLAVLPNAPKEGQPGATWSQDYTWNRRLGKVEQDVTYRLAGLERIAGIPVATVTGKAELGFQPDPSKVPADANAEVRMTEGSWQSHVMFDLQRGEVVGRHTQEARQIEIQAQAGGHRITNVMDLRVQRQILRIEEK